MRRIDWRRFVGPNYHKVSGILYGAWQAGQGVFAEKDAKSPEQLIFQWSQIQNAGREEKIWATLMLGPLLRGTITTAAAIAGYERALKLEPKLLHLSFVSKMTIGKLELLFQKTGLGLVAHEAARSLTTNAKRLSKEKSLQDLLGSLSDFHEAHYVLGIPRYAEPEAKNCGLANRGLLGFGTTGKVLALVLAILMDQGLMPRFLLPVSADIHFLRQMLATQAIVIPAKNPAITAYSLARVAREMSLALAPKDLPDFNEEISIASYILGSRVCSKHPEMTANPILPKVRNKTLGRSYIPINTLCQREARSRDLGRCSSLCPIEEFCTQVVPSGPYHEAGYLAPVRMLRRVLRPKGLV